MKRFTFILIFGFLGYALNAQSDLELITESINNYLNGTSNGKPELVKITFHSKLNLYSIPSEDRLKVWFGKDYISGIKEENKSNRVVRTVSIDYEKDIAFSKVEIIIPNKRIFIDYLMLLKVNGNWKIIHKSYTTKVLVTSTE
ncbi:nuclear transport factor 2 family protein [Winogradskyella flava]|uniref:nuclear transport factor 2 family protein n=1 Tax=Winogradskyella flava TaxID=1884876 RepID=UPI002492AF78|nr:nuclear transport factor 2 family protein [Winogradskyella flava]